MPTIQETINKALLFLSADVPKQVVLQDPESHERIFLKQLKANLIQGKQLDDSALKIIDRTIMAPDRTLMPVKNYTLSLIIFTPKEFYELKELMKEEIRYELRGSRTNQSSPGGSDGGREEDSGESESEG
jgi:hypothetical protein